MNETGMKQKLEILLNHWVEHNSGHAQEFTEWAEKSRGLGQDEIYRGIMEAARMMKEANESLLAALMKLKEV